MDLLTAYRKGEIPKYLKELKSREEERNRLIALIDLNCPPGHTVLTESDRVESLNIAEKSMTQMHVFGDNNNTFLFRISGSN